MTNQVFTTGYSGRTPEELKSIAEELDAVIFDVRFSPRSRVVHWTGKRLGELLGERYQHVKQFGNRNYKGGPIEIVDYEAGRILVEQSERPVILMCVCKDAHTCHRAVIADQLRTDGFEVEELPAPGSSGRKGGGAGSIFTQLTLC